MEIKTLNETDIIKEEELTKITGGTDPRDIKDDSTKKVWNTDNKGNNGSTLGGGGTGNGSIFGN